MTWFGKSKIVFIEGRECGRLDSHIAKQIERQLKGWCNKDQDVAKRLYCFALNPFVLVCEVDIAPPV
jgi:hypothetical protein